MIECTLIDPKLETIESRQRSNGIWSNVEGSSDVVLSKVVVLLLTSLSFLIFTLYFSVLCTCNFQGHPQHRVSDISHSMAFSNFNKREWMRRDMWYSLLWAHQSVQLICFRNFCYFCFSSLFYVTLPSSGKQVFNILDKTICVCVFILFNIIHFVWLMKAIGNTLLKQRNIKYENWSRTVLYKVQF